MIIIKPYVNKIIVISFDADFSVDNNFLFDLLFFRFGSFIPNNVISKDIVDRPAPIRPASENVLLI